MKPPYLSFQPLLLAITLLLTANVTAAQPTTKLMTYPLRPFSYQQDGMVTGFAVDIVNAIIQNSHIDAQIEMYPFNRGFQQLKSQSNTALFAIAKRPEREQNMKWVGPIITSGVYFYKKRSANLTLSRLDDLKRLQNVGVVLDNADHSYLNSIGFTNLSTDNDQLQSLKMLSYGRVDVAPMSELVMPFLAQAANIDINTIERTPIKLYDSTLYIAFSADTSDEIIAKWQQAFDQLKTSGHYQTIFDQYFNKEIKIANH